MKPEHLARQAASHLELLRPRLAEAIANLDTWAGLGWGRGGDGGGRNSGTSRPTEQTALAALERPVRDQFASERAELVQCLQSAELALRKAEQIVDRSRALPVGVVQAAQGCEKCSLVLVGGKPHEASWQPVYTRIVRPGNEEGPRIPLCSFHLEFWERYEEFPTTDIDLFHLDHLGTRIPRQLIRDQMPAAWALAQSKAAGKTLGRHNLGLEASA